MVCRFFCHWTPHFPKEPSNYPAFKQSKCNYLEIHAEALIEKSSQTFCMH